MNKDISHDESDGPPVDTKNSKRPIAEARSKGGDQALQDVPQADDQPPRRGRNAWLLFVVGGILAVAVAGSILWLRGDETRTTTGSGGAKEHPDENHEGDNAVELSPEAIKAAGITIVEVTRQDAGISLRVTGTVEPNQQQTQQVTPLVSGRVERVNVALGDRVRAGTVLAVVSSPEVAELHGKLHEAETRLTLAEENYKRVQKAENRIGVIQSKARLDEAETTLRRTHRLIELGAGAGKDLVAAETAYKTAKAEYDYQINITVNRETQQARADVETARVEASHLRNSLRSLGAAVGSGSEPGGPHDTSMVELVAPVSGTVTERLVNAGAGIEAGKPLFTISNISTVWVIASVPEGQVRHLQIGAPAEVRSAALAPEGIAGRVTYIDPILNQETRTVRVRVEVANTSEQLKVGMFVEIGFETRPVGGSPATELAVPEEAVQRLADRTVVFVPVAEEGHFEAREVEVGGVVNGYQRIVRGLGFGDRVVAKGSFTLKTQLLKGEMGGHSH